LKGKAGESRSNTMRRPGADRAVDRGEARIAGQAQLDRPRAT
jgi:hypothetical protein